MLPEVDKADIILFPLGVLTPNKNSTPVLKVSPTKAVKVPAEVLKWLDIMSYAPTFEVLETYTLGMNYNEDLVSKILNHLVELKSLFPVINTGSFEDVMCGIGHIIPRFHQTYITSETDTLFYGQPTIDFIGTNASHNILHFTHTLISEYTEPMTFSDRFTGNLICMRPEVMELFILPQNNQKHSPLLQRVLSDLQTLIRERIIYFTV